MIDVVERFLDKILTLLGAFLLSIKSWYDGKASAISEMVLKAAEAVLGDNRSKTQLKEQIKKKSNEELAKDTVIDD